jgi:Fur family transcriptional regulator, ferric uptake regulator
MQSAPEYRQYQAYLHEGGKNITPERMEVLSLVLQQKGHFKIEDIIRDSGKKKRVISRATIYRTLKTIEDAGLIKFIRSIHDEKIYEVVRGHHDHMICEHCGRIIEFHDSKLEALQDDICTARGFTPSRHVMKIFGTCSRCRGKHH